LSGGYYTDIKASLEEHKFLVEAENEIATNGKTEKNEHLSVLKNAHILAVAGRNVFDEIQNEETDILLKSYSTDEFYWDENDILFFWNHFK